MIRNTDQRSRDYSNIMDVYRPGHADYTFDESMAFVITGAADVLPEERPLEEWQQVL